MNKKKIAAVAAVVSYINVENENRALKEMKKRAYENLNNSRDNQWQCQGITSIMAGKRFNTRR